MRIVRRGAWIGVLGVGLVAAASLAWGERWKPYGFEGPDFYKYRIVSHEGGERTEVIYALDIAPAEDVTAAGGPHYRVRTSSEHLVKAEDLGPSTLFGGVPVLGLVPMLMFGNPMFASMLGELDLVVGEKMSFFGMGYAKVVGMETVAGVEGFLCEIHLREGDEEQKLAEIVVNPDLALPLRSRSYDDGEVTFEMTLLEHRRP